MKTPFELLESLETSLREAGDTFVSEILLEGVQSGTDIPDSHIKKINKFTRRSPDKESLYTFPVLMIDTAPTRNAVIYTETSQKKSVKSWPGTTYLFNANGMSDAGLFGGQADHRLASASQIGRIYDAQVVETPKGKIGTLGRVYTVAGTESTDAFIHKVDAGILREVSIHVQVPDGVECSICSDKFSNCTTNTKTKANPNGIQHYPREKFEGKTAYMSTGSGILVPLELSNVACPGSVNAHIMQDEEVQNYKVVSLREALGGSREVINLITQGEKMKPELARVKLQEAAIIAGISLEEVCKDEAHKELLEAADIQNWSEMTKKKGDGDGDGDDNPKGADGDRSDKGEKKDMMKKDPPEDDKEKKQSSSDGKKKLFEGNCPVCLHDSSKESSGSSDRDSIEAEIRTEYSGILKKVADSARETIADLEAKLEAANAGTNAAEAFTEYVEQTVTIAIETGHKTVEEKNAYRETLVKLPFAGVKEIRETLRSSNPTRTEVKSDLAKRMAENLKNNGVGMHESGDNRVSQIARKPKLAATR